MKKFLKKFRFRILEKLIGVYWWCEDALLYLPSRHTGTKSKIFFDPFSATALITTLIVTGISIGTQLIISALAPKPKAPPQRSIEGQIQFTDSAWGEKKKRIHGQRAADGIGGVKVGVNIIFASDIRKIETPVPGTASTGGGGKGNGGNKSTSTQTQTNLKIDVGAAIGEGRLRLLRLEFNEDIVFDNANSVLTEPAGTKYEAEAGTKSGGASNASVAGFSGGSGVTNLNGSGQLLLALAGGSPDTYALHIGYKSTTDVTCDIELGGETIGYTFPATGNVRAYRTIYKALPAGTNNLKFKNASSSNLKLDAVVVEAPLPITSPDDLYYTPSGIYDPYQSAPLAKNNLIFEENDYRSIENINRMNLPVIPQSVAGGFGDTDGVITATLSNGCQMAFYPGSEDQPVDAVYSAWVASQPGKSAAYAQAFLGTSWVRLQDLDFTKWGSFPQIRATVENMDTGTVQEILLAEAALVGIIEDDLNLTAASDKICRGYLVIDNAAPQKAFSDLAIIHNLVYSETSDGKLTAFDKNVRIPVATITRQDLGAYVADEQATPPVDDVVSVVPVETEMPQTLEMGYFNPLAPVNFATDKAAHIFPFTDSVKKETFSINTTLLPDESKRIVSRLNQEKWLKIAPEKFSVSHKWGWIDAGECIEVEIGGAFKLLRVESKQGAMPGKFDIVATNDELYVSADGEETTIRTAAGRIFVPAATLGTIMELPPLFNEQTPGVYVPACPVGPGNWNGAALYRLKGEEWQKLVTFNKKALMGRAVNALDDAPGDYEAGDIDTDAELAVDFYNNFQPDSVTEEALADGANMFVSGNEIVYVQTWERDNDYANRWIGTNIIRRGKATIDSGHAIGERVVYFTDAVKFLPLEPEERGIERTWKFVSDGEAIDKAAPISFTWGGGTAPPEIDSLNLYPQTEVVNDLSVVKSIYGLIVFNPTILDQRAKVYWKKPSESYELLTDVPPDDGLVADFRAVNLREGTHKFKIVVVAGGVEQLETPVEHTVVVNPTSFTIDNRVIVNAADRAFTGFDSAGRYRGADTTIVPLAVIAAQVIKGPAIDNGVNVDVNVAGEITGARVTQSSQGDSVFQSKVEVFNKFGESVKQFVPDGFTGAGTLGKGTYPRKFADPFDEAIFKVQVRNYYGWSLPKYLKGTTLSDSFPSVLSRANVVTELTGSPISSSKIRFSGTFTFGANTLTLQKRNVGQGPADWVDHETGIPSLPHDAAGLAENTELEFRMVSSANETYTSNIVRAKTYAQAQEAPTYPAPISLSGAPDVTNPTTKLNFSFISKGNVATEVWLEGADTGDDVSAVAVDATGTFSIDSLTPGATYHIKIRHDYGSGHFSDFTTEIIVSTDPADPGDLPPSIDYSYYALSGPFPFYALYYFTPHGGSGTYLLETREITDIDPDPDWEVLDPAFPTGIPQWGFPVTQIEVTRIFEGRMKRNDVSGYSNVATVYVPPVEEYGGGTCFVGETVVTLADYTKIRFDELYQRRAEFVNKRYVKSFDFLNRFHSGLILAVIETTAQELVEIKFKDSKRLTRCKPEHRFWTEKRRFTAIKNLCPGDKVYFDDGEKLRLRQIESVTPCSHPEGIKVYNLSVKIHHSYLADGNAVSNFKEL